MRAVASELGPLDEPNRDIVTIRDQMRHNHLAKEAKVARTQLGRCLTEWIKMMHSLIVDVAPDGVRSVAIRTDALEPFLRLLALMQGLKLLRLFQAKQLSKECMEGVLGMIVCDQRLAAQASG